MAAALQATVFSQIPSDNATTVPKKPAVIVSISTPSRSKITKRKNYLRPKLLKTLAKPYSTPLLPQEHPQNPIVPIEPNGLEAPSDHSSCERCSDAAGEDGAAVVQSEQQSHEFHISESSVGANSVGISDGSGQSFSTGSVVKLVLSLVGIFVFQTVCAVWVLRSVEFDRKDGSLEREDESKASYSDRNGTKKVKPLLNGNSKFFFGNFGSRGRDIVFVDESELEEKIVQIRGMAREARESEGNKSMANGLVSSLDDVEDGEVVAGKVSRVRSGIEKEVDARLFKLQKSLNSMWERSLVSLISYLSKPGKVEDRDHGHSSDVKEINGALMFKKKLKFRSRHIEMKNKPKGFQRLEDGNHCNIKSSNSGNADPMMKTGRAGNGGLDLLDREQQPDLPNCDLWESVSMPLEEAAEGKQLNKDSKALQIDGKKLQNERRRKKVGKEIGFQNTGGRIGVVQETSNGRSSVKAAKSKGSSQVETQNSQSFTKDKQDNTTESNRHAGLSTNHSSKSKGGRRKSKLKKVMDEQSDIMTDLWWMNLPYVLVIFMHRSSDREGPGGLFALIASGTQDQSNSSYTVAFEDRGDATNFCYILETFFEDLGDFSADIIPLSIKELDEAVKSRTMKVIVVKKGQIQLYAGQPLADVEMALHSLIEPGWGPHTPKSK